jgi:hypothetical protein
LRIEKNNAKISYGRGLFIPWDICNARMNCARFGVFEKFFSVRTNSTLTNSNMIAPCNNKSNQVMSATVPKAYICTLTNKMMIDPLVNRYGISYERAAIIDHITIQMKPYCPKTKKPLTVRDLVPNVKLRMEIMKYRHEVLGDDTATTSMIDDDAIREVECIRATMYALSPPNRPKKGLIGSRRHDMKKMLSRFTPGCGIKKV